MPGLLLAAGLAFLAIYLSEFSDYLGAALTALALGVVLGNTGMLNERFDTGFRFTEKRVLEAAIVLIGFGLNARIFSSLGWSTWLFVAGSVIATLFVALLIGRLMGLSRGLGALLGAGSAICGTAAIGALAPLLDSREEETGLSIGVINLLSTVGLVLLPVFSGLLAMEVDETGLLIGGVLQSMGHVIGAGFSIDNEVGAAATVVKMGRILFIIPLMVVAYFMSRGRSKGRGAKGFPFFIPLFAAALALSQLPFFPAGWAEALADIGDFLLIMAMVAIGFKIRLKPLFRIAGPALVLGTLVFVFQIAIYLVYLYW